MREILTTTAFEGDLRRVRKFGWNPDRLQAIVALANWLLLFKLPPKMLILVRTGTHVEPFGN